ncbi:CLUMA_CG000420, isoform A [Clunio marinus]|uniref:CLUMA_CG000420, isoform A n=1 Tax=Clunio marinus TaxID=568069 RepID=A0A1J1HET4_9DIPT|nr:CLUMA_CG000420, isoform A [Clunio marinus]
MQANNKKLRKKSPFIIDKKNPFLIHHLKTDAAVVMAATTVREEAAVEIDEHHDGDEVLRAA